MRRNVSLKKDDTFGLLNNARSGVDWELTTYFVNINMLLRFSYADVYWVATLA
jgi:hypothetical protein